MQQTSCKLTAARKTRQESAATNNTKMIGYNNTAMISCNNNTEMII